MREYKESMKMFSKYVSKITNTIGTVNYLQQKSKKGSERLRTSQWRNSSKHNIYDGGLDVCSELDNGTNNNNHINIDLSTNPNRILNHYSSTESEIILKLRNTLFRYELV